MNNNEDCSLHVNFTWASSIEDVPNDEFNVPEPLDADEEILQDNIHASIKHVALLTYILVL